jgi:hypothetical protein
MRECGDIVSRADLEACAAPPDNASERPQASAPFRRHRRGDGGSTIQLVREDYCNLRTAHRDTNKVIGDKYAGRMNCVHQCSFRTSCIPTHHRSTMAPDASRPSSNVDGQCSSVDTQCPVNQQGRSAPVSSRPGPGVRPSLACLSMSDPTPRLRRRLSVNSIGKANKSLEAVL